MDHNDIAGIYSAFQTTFITEAKKGPGDQNLPGAKGKSNQKGGFAGLGKKEKGPHNIKGVEAPHEEPQRKSKNIKNVKKTKKMAKESINTGMRNNLFDRLYEEVMDDDNAALGLETGEDFDAEGADMGEESDEVTFTLPRNIAQQLHDALMGQLGGEEDMGEDEMRAWIWEKRQTRLSPKVLSLKKLLTVSPDLQVEVAKKLAIFRLVQAAVMASILIASVKTVIMVIPSLILKRDMEANPITVI
jgi:hypothetical protein